MSELSRREAIRRSALSLTALGAGALVPAPLSRELGTMVHAALQEQPATSERSQAFLEHEWRLLRLLAETIIPADERSGSALEAGAPEFIGLLASNNDELRRILSAGMLWLDHESTSRYGAVFVEAADRDRTELLDLLAAKVVEEDPGYEGIVDSIEYAGFHHYTTEPRGQLGPGVRFFSWVRRLVVDAFYTSPIGMADVDYQGNDVLRRFQVPREPLQYALRRSPFRDE
ncbi:MAG: gluconate 2-dehydrogenase subunit 3 family protein [Acidobacteriota bacterium]|nr:gluconate 2-dehydrogenase subunit 3 family protein [Acidobacteriota bacterium]